MPVDQVEVSVSCMSVNSLLINAVFCSVMTSVCLCV